MGRTNSEGGGDPFPVELPGEEKPVISSKIGEYVNSEFLYYYQVYSNTKHCGQPLAGAWTDWPGWIPQLMSHFDSAVDKVRAHNEREAYRMAGVR